MRFVRRCFDLPITIKQDRNFDYIFVEGFDDGVRVFYRSPGLNTRPIILSPASSVSLYDCFEVRRISGKDLPVYR